MQGFLLKTPKVYGYILAFYLPEVLILSNLYINEQTLFRLEIKDRETWRGDNEDEPTKSWSAFGEY